MKRFGVVFASVSLLVGLGCNKESSDAAEAPAAAEANAARPAQNDKPAAKPKSRTKDRGAASMTLGDSPWTADRASARQKPTSLVVKASRTERTSNGAARQEIHLKIDAFKGPGEYKAAISGSRFIAVGVDAKAAAGAKTDKEVTKATSDVLSKAKHMMLGGATVTIETINDTEVVGSFAWTPPAGQDKPAISGGKFRALIK